MTQTLELQEGGRLDSQPLPHAVATTLARLQVANVAPAFRPGEYDVTNIRKVGVFTSLGVTVRIQPKTPIQRLVAMLSYARDPGSLWRDEAASFEANDDLFSSIAYAFSLALRQSLGSGLLKGYITREEALPVVRGRWRVTDQLTRRAGQPLPLEISYDDFVDDIPLNQVLKSAITRLLRFQGLSGKVTTELRVALRLFDDVTMLPLGSPIPNVVMDRSTARYRTAYELAKLVLSNMSLEHHEGTVVGSGFLIDLWTVFEDFVSAAVTQASHRPGVNVEAQRRSRLDRGGRVGIAPDLVWSTHGHVAACADVKYKVEHRSQFPNADIYQMIAYCTRFGLGEGHLIYAAGESELSTIEVINGPVIHQHALRLDVPFETLIAQVVDVADQIASASSSSPSSRHGWSSGITPSTELQRF